MKLRLLDLVELVIALGCGLALAHACLSQGPSGALRLRYLVEPFLVGTALVGAGAIWWETLTHRDRRPWGIGRWTWVVAGSVVFIDQLGNLAMWCAITWKQGRAISYDQLLKTTLGSCTTQFYGQVSYLLLVIWVARRFSGAIGDPEPDGREYAGRMLLVTIVLWGPIYRINQVASIP